MYPIVRENLRQMLALPLMNIVNTIDDVRMRSIHLNAVDTFVEFRLNHLSMLFDHVLELIEAFEYSNVVR